MRRMGVGFGIVVYAAGSLLTGCGGGSSEGSDAAPRGKQRFVAVCAPCHGAAGQGQPGLGKSLLDSELVATAGDDELITLVITGRAAEHPANSTGLVMPPKGGDPTLTEAEIRQVIEYLRELRRAHSQPAG